MSTNEDRKVGLSSEFDASGIQSGVQTAKDALKQLPAAAKDAATGAGAPLEDLGKKTEAAAKKLERDTKSLASQIQRTNTALASGGRNTAAYFEAIGKQKGIDPNTLAPYLAQLKATEAAQNSAGKSLETVGMSAKATAAALRQVPAQFTDIVTSLASGQQPLTVLLQQGGQLKDVFGGVGNAARALGGYVVGLVNPFTLTAAALGGIALAAYQGAQELPALQKQLILSGDAAGYTASKLVGARDAVAALSGATKGRSAEVLGDIAASAGIGADNLERFTVTAIEFERAGGDAAEKTAAAFKSLAKDPLTAALKLNETTNFLTRSTYEQIRALVEQGKTAEAARVAQEAYDRAVNTMIPKLEANLSILARAWRGATDGAKEFWDAALNIGRADSLDQKLQKARDNLAAWQGLTGAPTAGPGFNPLAGMLGGQVDAAREQVRALEEQKRSQEASAKAAADQAKQVQALNKWREEGNRYLSDAEQLQRALTKVQELGVAAGVKQTEIDKQKLKVQQQYDKGLTLDRIAEAENARNEQIKRGLIEVNALRERGAINDFEAIERSAALEQQNFASQRLALQERLGYAKQRQNSEKEVSQLTTQLAAVTQASLTSEFQARQEINNLLERKRILLAQAYETEAQQNRADIDAYQRREFDNRARLEAAQLDSARALREENDLLQLQASLIGSTEAQRTRAIEFYRIELDLKKQILEIDQTDTPNGEADREALRVEARAQAAQRKLQAQQRETIDEWTRGVDQIYSSLTDALLRGFEDGKGYGRNLIDTLKNMFGTLVLRPIIQPIIGAAGNMLASLFGIGGSAGGSAASSLLGGAAGGSSLFSSLGNLGSLGSLGMQLAGLKGIFGLGAQLTGLTGAGTGIALEGAGSMIANGSITQGLAQGAGALAPWALGAAGGLLGGKAISGGLSLWGSGNTTINAGTALGAIFAGPIGAAVGGVVGGLINRAFGRGPKQVTESGIEGSIGGGDFSGQTYAYWKQKGGWFSSNRYGTDFGMVSNELDDMLDTSAGLLLKTTSEWAKSLGLPAQELLKVTASIKTKLTGNVDEDKKAIEAVLQQYQEALTGHFKDALTPFQKAGEDLTATLQRLVGLQQFSDTINSLGGVFSKVARSSVDAREGLLALVGGADEFIKMATGFVGNYYSRDEIAGGKAANIRDTLRGLGISPDIGADDAKAQFRKLVESTDVSTEEGQKRLATLLGIQGDFADVAGYLSETGKSLTEVAKQAPGFDVLAPLLATGTSQQVQATQQVQAAVEQLTEVVKQQGGMSGGGSDYISNSWREVGLATAR